MQMMMGEEMEVLRVIWMMRIAREEMVVWDECYLYSLEFYSSRKKSLSLQAHDKILAHQNHRSDYLRISWESDAYSLWTYLHLTLLRR
jgi:hypothetical protein